MSKLALTRSQIINQGLSLAGRPDLIADARLWLNLFLEEFYYNQDVEWLVKSGAALTVSQGLDFPSDYRAAKSALVTYNGTPKELDIINDASEYDAKSAAFGDGSGIPELIYANHDERKFYFLPQPQSSGILNLKYYYIPAISDSTDSSGDEDIPKWEYPNSILIDFIKSMAFEYNDDSRQNDARQLVQMKIAQSKLNARDVRAGHTRIKMGKRFRKRF